MLWKWFARIRKYPLVVRARCNVFVERLPERQLLLVEIARLKDSSPRFANR